MCGLFITWLNRYKLAILIIVLLIQYSTAYALPWRYELTPYLWAINMNGRVAVGNVTSHLDESFADILNQLNVGGMLYASAHKDNFGLYFNGLYAVLSNDERIDGVTVDVNNHFGIFGAGVSYIALDRNLNNDRNISLEPYLGFRYTLNNTKLKVLGFSFKKNVNWTDPVVGLRLNYALNKQWSALFTGDIGGTNASTHASYSVGAFLGYQGQNWKMLKTYFGYHVLDQHYQTGSGSSFYDWDMKIFGPLLGISLIF